MSSPTPIMLVTGATDGIGKATALELARRGARVVIHGRSADKLAAAQAEICAAVPGALIETAAADLSALAQVRALAADIAARFERLDVLIHNAGTYAKERRLSADGYELTFAVNHLAPFLLTAELLPLLRAGRARVISVSSLLHRRAQIDFDDLQMERNYDGGRAYGMSKLANVLFANALARREAGVLTANSLHPGVVNTKLLRAAFDMPGSDTAKGAETSVYLATSPDVAGVTGKYFSDSREANANPAAQDLALQDRLWEVSERLVAGMSA